ncbi:MAG TPA: calcium-binding protein, partial [Allosphingosinicella sp.]
DHVSGGGSEDFVDYSMRYAGETGTIGVIVNLSAQAYSIHAGHALAGGSVAPNEAIDNWGGRDTLVGIESAVGGDLDDVMIGSDFQNNSFSGNGGNDRFVGGSGSDRFFGGSGNDLVDYSAESGTGGIFVNLEGSGTLVLAPGGTSVSPGRAIDSFGAPDTLAGIEQITTGGQADTVQGNGLDNRISLGAGSDVGYGGGGDDLIIGAEGDDRLYGGSGGDRLEGGDGSDTLVGDPGADSIDAGAGDDSVQAGADNDIVRGGGDNDDLGGDDGDDQLFGDSGNDNMRGGRGVDSFDGGSGGEALDLNSTLYGDKVTFFDQFATQSAVADLRTGIISNDGFGNGETMVNIESLGAGTAFADTFYGNDNRNGLLGSIGDFLHGFGGDDHIDLEGAVALIDGGDGVDSIRLRIHGALLLPNEAGFADYMAAMTSGWKVDLAAGTLRDGYGNSGNVAGIENVTGSELADDLRGSALDNRVDGGGGADVLRLHDGGDDTVNGGTGNDNIFFIGSLTAADVVNGGEGTDTLILQGAYGSLTLTANVTQIENISILGGNNTAFGGSSGNRHDYVLTTHDSNFAAGIQARINGAALLAGEDFTFDGSAETDALFVVYGGKGRDTLTGGQGNDIFFYAEERFASGDTVNGGAGYDGMFLRGNYTIDFNAPGYTGLFTNIENLTLSSATDERFARGGGTEFDYNLTLSDAIVNPGYQLTVSGAVL